METDLKRFSEERKERASALLKKAVPEVVNATTYLVPSSDGTTKYEVSHIDTYSCTCPDFQKRCKNKNVFCKHIHSIILLNKLKNKVEMEGFDVDSITEKKVCPECKSEDIIQKGIRKNKSGNKQKYRCVPCGAWFIIDPAKHLKGNARIVCLTLDMYYKGNSLRDIQDTLYKNFGLKLHHETIRRWINRFMGKINDYTNTLKPQTSDIMHLDEQCLSIKGNNEWCWNALDDGTRFLIATQITKVRRIKDARGIIKKAKLVISQKPDVVATDKGHFYKKAIRKEFPTQANTLYPTSNRKGVNHFTKKVDNQLIERYHATFRERDKVIRGFKSEKTANRYLDNWRTFYNFVRPHTSLNGLTPSEVAGISIGIERNRWMSLIKLSSEANQGQVTNATL